MVHDEAKDVAYNKILYRDGRPPFSVVNAFAESRKAAAPDLRSHLPLDLCWELVQHNVSKRISKEHRCFHDCYWKQPYSNPTLRFIKT